MNALSTALTAAEECPDLNACVKESIWCDGIAQCPPGEDDSFTRNPSQLPPDVAGLQTQLRSLSLMDMAVFDE
ncbi:hypothetical protein quinque_003587 [Culex quinquefasciatus]